MPAPILSLALRSRSMPETYLAEGLPRLGLRFRKSETASPKAARKALRHAIADTARSYVEPAVPKSFWVNCGLSGLEKWRRMLVDTKDKKGWPALFSQADRAFAGLVRAYECIEHEATAPAGGRAFYADFLDEAAPVLARPALTRAANKYRESGRAWAEIASLIAGCGDVAVREACDLTDRRLELSDTNGERAVSECEAMIARQQTLGRECTITAADARTPS